MNREQVHAAIEEGVCLRYADFSSLNLHDMVFHGDFSHANFAGADVTNCNFADANLQFANFESAGVQGCYFAGANLQGAKFNYTNMRAADFSGADMRSAQFLGMENIDITGANLQGATIPDMFNVLCDNEILSGGFPTIRAPVVTNLHAKLKAAIHDDTLDMSCWHACKTTHCIAGWIVTLADAEDLASYIGTQFAAACIYRASVKGGRVPHFYSSKTDALKWVEALCTPTDC